MSEQTQQSEEHAAAARAAAFDESKLAKPGDWANLDDDVLAAELDAMASSVDDTFEAVKRELAAEKAAKAKKAAAAASASTPALPPPAS